MDDVSGGGFLMGNDVGLGDDWVEMPWLKAMGYYSMEAFVANRLEMSLRWAWFNRSSNKKGVRLKEKLKEKAAAAAVGGNAFFRKKGFCDWWMKLDHTIRVKAFRMVFGKAAKCLVDDVVQRAYEPIMKDKSLNFSVKKEQKHKYNSYMTHRRSMNTLSDNKFGSAIIPISVSDDHASLHTTFHRFLVLQDIVSILSSYQYNDFDEEKLFFSTLSSVYTISECLLRKHRGLLMLVSLECTKLELLRNFERQQQKSSQISVPSKHRKKGRSRNTKQSSRNESDRIMSKCYIENDAPVAKVANNKDITHHLVNENPPVATVARSGKKGRRKNSSGKSNSCLKDSDGGVTFKVNPNLYTSGGLETEKLASSSDNSPFLGSKPSLTDIGCLEPGPCSCSESNETISVNYTDNHSRNHFDCSKKKSLHAHANGNMLKNDIEDDDRAISFQSTTRIDNHSSEIKMNDSLNGCRVASFLKTTDYGSNPCLNSEPKFECVYRGDTSSQNSKKSVNCMKSVLNCPSVKVAEKEKTYSKLQGRESDEIIDTADHRRFVDYLLCDCADINNVPHLHHQYMNFHHPSTITERLHLDVGRNWHDRFHWSLLPARISSVESGGVCVGSQQVPLSLDWPPMVRSIHRVVQPMTYNNYDYGDFASNKKSPFWRAGFTGHGIQPAGDAEGDGKHPAEFGWPPGWSTTQKITGESESFRFSEEEMEMHSVAGMDYSQYFGGGLMYWNSSDPPGIGFSRPPSLSSEDNSWAWHDTDLVRSVDDIVAFSSSYSTTGLTSPTTTHLYSPFDTPSIGGSHGHGYVPPMNEFAGTTFPSASKVQDHFMEECAPGYLPPLSDDPEAKTWDSLPHPVLRPIIIPSMAAKKSMSEFSYSRGHKSPCVPPLKDRARMKRPPSPIVLSVSNVPCTTASISSTGDSRRQKGFPIVRSGSSSPRNSGLRGCYQDVADIYTPRPCLDGSEVMWPSCRKRNLSTHTLVPPLPGGTLLHDHIITLSQLACDQDHPDVAFPLEPPEMTKCPTRRARVHSMQNLLHDEIELFCKRVASDNNIRKPYINWAVQRVAKSLQDLWPRSKSNIYGSSATGLSLPTSDVDLVVCLPPVRNLEPIKEAGILEGRNGIKETCLQIVFTARCKISC